MNLITPDDFYGEIHIGQVSSPDVQELLQYFIEKYEPRLLLNVLGKELKDQVIADSTSFPELVEKLKPMIANFVYYHYQDYKITEIVGTGTVKPSTQNAVQSSPYQKMVRAWNEMVEMQEDLKGFEGVNPVMKYKHINSLNL